MNLRSIAFWIMISLVIGLCFYLLHWIKTESFECLNNPYGYSVRLLEEANDAPVSCMCTPQKPNAITVGLTKDGFVPLEELLEKSK